MFYLGAVLITLALAMLSRQHMVAIVAAVMFTQWAVGNLIVDNFGFTAATYLNPVLDVAWSFYVGTLLHRHRERWLLGILCIFVIMGCAHVAYHFTTFYTSTGMWAYFATLNVLFLAQVVITGARGAFNVDWRGYWNSAFRRMPQNNLGDMG